jgi:hypothetical protein
MSFYIWTRMASLLTWQRKPRETSEFNPPWELFRSCDTLTLDRFEQCLLHSDLSKLIKSGNPPEAEISEAWANIYAEYLDINQGNEAHYLLQLRRELVLMEHEIHECDTALYCLNILYDKRLVDVLIGNGLSCSISDEWTQEEYEMELERVNNQLSSKRFQLDIKNRELSDYMKAKANNTVDPLFFDKQLIQLARFRNVAFLRKTEVTVKEYVLMVEDLQTYNSQQKESSKRSE